VVRYYPPLNALGDDRDEDGRDGLSPWAYASLRRWAYSFWVQGLETAEALELARLRQKRLEKRLKRAEAVRLPERERILDPPASRPRLNQEAAPPPSEVGPRQKPKPASRSPRKRRTRRRV
jgi:hypothetical protein